MAIKILTLQEAATILNMTPEGLRLQVIAGKIPGAKIGKRWSFYEEDLVQHLRSLYTNDARVKWSAHTEEKSLCHSTKEVTFGGLSSPTVDKKYRELLGLPTSKKRSASMTNSEQNSGR